MKCLVHLHRKMRNKIDFDFQLKRDKTKQIWRLFEHFVCNGMTQENEERNGIVTVHKHIAKENR